MWTRTRRMTAISKEEESLVKCLISALSNDTLVQKLNEVLIEDLKFQVNSLKDINSQLKTDIANLTSEYKEFKSEVVLLRQVVKKKDSDVAALNEKVHLLEESLDKQEQYSRRNNVRISNMKEIQNEFVQNRVMKLFNQKMGCDLEPSDIDRVHRVGPASIGQPRPIIVKFTSYQARRKVMQNKQSLKNKGTHDDPNASFEEDGDIIFINEDLTKHRANLLWRARQLKKKKKINDCWSFDGAILFKDKKDKIAIATDLIFDKLEL
jgi:hypothetical protein